MHMKADDLQRYLARARERFGDRLLTWLTLLLVVLTFVIVPLHAAGLIVTQGYVFAIVLVMALYCRRAGWRWSRDRNAVRGRSRRCGRRRASHGPPRPGMVLDAAAWVTVGAALAYVVARAVFAPGRVTYHRITGAVLLYLTIGQIFVGLYGMVDLVVTHSLSGVSVAEAPKLLSDLIYFSFSMLTTVGYGDIVPVHPIARSLSSVKAIIASSTLLLCWRGLSPWSLKTAAGNQAIML